MFECVFVNVKDLTDLNTYKKKIIIKSVNSSIAKKNFNWKKFNIGMFTFILLKKKPDSPKLVRNTIVIHLHRKHAVN